MPYDLTGMRTTPTYKRFQVLQSFIESFI